MNRDRDFTTDIASNDEPIQLKTQHPHHHHLHHHHHHHKKQPKYSLSIDDRHPRERSRSDDEDLDEMDDDDDAMSNDHGKATLNEMCGDSIIIVFIFPMANRNRYKHDD